MTARIAIATLLLVACGSPNKPPATPTPPTPDAGVAPPEKAAVEDPYLWLEDVTSDRALAWAREQNAKTQTELEAEPSFAATRDRVRAILDSKENLPIVSKRKTLYYNIWKDEKNPRGLIRRTSLAEYVKPSPRWETVLDIDALAAKEKENWVYVGTQWLEPTYERSLIKLSRGGADAAVVREFDPVRKQLLPGAFELPEAKQFASWKDKDTLYVSTDLGPGSMTQSGYPRIVKEWKRGTKLADAVTVYEGQPTDLGTYATRSWDHGRRYDVIRRYLTIFTSESFLRDDAGKLTKLDVPPDAQPRIWNGQLLVSLRSDFTADGKTWPKGALLATPLDDFLAGKRAFTMIFEPTPRKSLADMQGFKSALVTVELEDVHNKLVVWTLAGGKWSRKPFAAVSEEAFATASAWPVDELGDSDDYWLSTSGFLTPLTLYKGTLGKGAPKLLKKSPTFFDAKGLTVEQHFATSRDGTKVPYFQIARQGLALDGTHPTILYGYGGFEISMAPAYDAVSGAAWSERGGVYVVANIRGGGEYGPAWHQAAVKADRQRAYDDFIAVAEDLIARKVTATPHLGIMGGSNGGLLVGVMLAQRPDLFGAVVCQQPLLDMKRYTKLLAGASWAEEYGDPDKPEEWAWIAKYSPYHNIKPGVHYPRTLFTTSTRDDRVHPGHARKMMARMLEQGHDVLFYENIEGGHAGAADHEQSARLEALAYTFLAKELGLK